MEINIDLKDNIIQVQLKGKLDTIGDEKFSEALNKVRKIKDYEKIIFDFTDVLMISSASIGRMLNFYKFIDSTERTMEIHGISDALYQQFHDIHLHKIFTIKR
ncbi:MAG: anti-sigma factor antagonist [Spirochaetales bacterium]|nr:anti-sigma factor antagonist [Spirochaetales bacterium]